MSDPYKTRFDGHIKVSPPCGDGLVRLTQGYVIGRRITKPAHDPPYLPFRLNDFGWLIMADQSPRQWEDAPKRLKAICTLLRQYDYELEGVIEWQGDDKNDFGMVTVSNDLVLVLRGQRVYLPATTLVGDEREFRRGR